MKLPTKSARVLKFDFPLVFKFEQLTQSSLPKVTLEVDYVRLEVEIKLFGIVSSILKASVLRPECEELDDKAENTFVKH